MKQVLFILLIVTGICSCNKHRGGETSKTFEYKIECDETGIDGPDLILEGFYVDATGDTISVSSPLPFELTIKEVPLHVKAYFSGYIFGENVISVTARCYLEVKSEPNNDYVVNDKYDISITSNNSNNDLTEDELKEKTAFSLSEK
ncbi:MAG: hypothetical protein ACRDDZ_10760 [Marinifilaceae bacterium]